MISLGQIKSIRALHRNKERDEAGLFIAEGDKVVNEALALGIAPVALYCTEETFGLNRSVEITQIRATEMARISALATPSTVLGVFRKGTNAPPMEQLASGRVLILDGIRDPGNLGTIIRSASWFGHRHIIASTDTVDCHNPKVVQSTMGSIFKVSVFYLNLVESIAQLQSLNTHFQVFGAVLNGKSPEVLARNPVGALVIGNESRGISDAILDILNERITIAGAGEVESLNAAISASILLYAWHPTLQSSGRK